VRVRGKVLSAVGAGYLTGCVLLAVGTSAGQPGLRLAGLGIMAAAYGLGAAGLLLPKRRQITGLELVLLLVFGILFRLTLLIGCSTGTGIAGVAAAPAPSPAPPLLRLLSLLLFFLEPEVWIGRLLMLMFELGSWALLLMLLEGEHRPSAWLLLYVWSPVAVVASGAGALSSATVFFLVLGLWALRVGLVGRGVISLGLGASGSYLAWPALVAMGVGPLRKGLVGALVVGAVVLSAAAAAWMEPGWASALYQTVVGETHNAGLFALVEWATRSRWPAWVVAGLLCGAVGWALRGSRPTTLFGGVLKAAVVTSPVVRAGGLHVLLPFVVLRPSVVWAGFPCVVLLLEAAWPDGDVPVRWLLVEYGVLAAGLVLEEAWRRRAVAKREAG